MEYAYIILAYRNEKKKDRHKTYNRRKINVKLNGATQKQNKKTYIHTIFRFSLSLSVISPFQAHTYRHTIH